MKSIVVKIGGSVLFSDSQLHRSVSSLLAEHQDKKLFLIFGGGDLVESMRTLDRLYSILDENWLHWKCVELLDTTWEVACKCLPFLTPIFSAAELRNAMEISLPTAYAVRVSCYYDRSIHAKLENRVRPAANWKTTTDSLAWLLAHSVGAKELLLVKSCDIDPQLSTFQLAEQEIVDSELPRLAKSDPSIDIRLCK